MTTLKLIALEPDDLALVSAHLQDAVLTVGDMAFRADDLRFVMLLNRFDWLAAEARTPTGANGTAGERRRAALRIERVLGAKTTGIDLARVSDPLELLALQFEPAAEPPGGQISLVFAGGGAIRLDVECVEVAVEDVGAAWRAVSRPRHDDGGPTAG